jgi:hypothetical protein
MTAGSASTVAFTPVQGIEISNQQQQDLKAGYKSAYFSSTLFKH